VSLAPPPSTPEPSTMILLGLGSFAMFVVKKRSSRSS
jgi:hypothetical protein